MSAKDQSANGDVVGGPPRMSSRLGYLVPEFPGQTHIMMWREVRALRRMGEDLALLSTRRPPATASRHDFADAAFAQTRYLFPPDISSLAAWTAAGCPGLGKGRDYLRGLARAGFKRRVQLLGLLASAVDLVRWARLERIDHIHGHSCADAAHVLAMARRMGGPPYSLTLHGDLSVYGTDHASKMEGAAFVCVVGNHLRKQVLAQTAVPGNRVFVTCMGVETSDLASLGHERPYSSGVLHLATIARLHPAKGHVHALAAMQLGLQAGLNLHYTIAGEGVHRDALISEIDKLGLASHVTLTGTLPETEVFQLLSKADAFVLPSIGVGEAWPVSVMEAMAAGLPVIASEIGATREMIAHGVDGLLVPQKDERALLENITLLARDLDARRRIGEAARRTAQQRFDVRGTATLLRDAALRA